MQKIKQQLKQWLALMAIVFLVISNFPTVQFAEGIEEAVKKDDLEMLIAQAKDINLENKTEDSKNHLLAVLEEAIQIVEDTDATQQQVDDIMIELQYAINNLKERGPPVNVDIRIELHDRTLVDKMNLDVEPFDIKDYISNHLGNNPVNAEEAKAIHAIIRALETVNGLDVKGKDFDLGYGGNYIAEIAGHGQFTHGSFSGWKFFVNDEFVPRGVGEYALQEGDSIVLFYVHNFADSTYTRFEKEFYKTNVDEQLTLKLHGQQEYGNVSLENISLLVNDEVFEVEGSPVLLNEEGEATVTFTKSGTYRLSATRTNDAGEINIVRPYATVEVSEKVVEDKEPPVITVDGITDGKTFNVAEVTFSVTAHDNEDETVNVVVLLNDEEVVSSEVGKYNVSLIEGENVIEIIATDSSNNIATEKITVTYEVSKPIVDVDEALTKVIDYILEKGVTGEWQAIGLSRAGIEVPVSYSEIFNRNIEEQITNGLENKRIKITDIERLALAAIAINRDATNVSNVNLIELIYNSPIHINGSDTMTLQGNNGLAFALITLDAGNFDVPAAAKWTREKIIDEILKGQKENGGWSLNAMFPQTSVDVTVMVITALASYTDNPEVKNALDKAVHYLKNEQNDNGGFSEPFVGGENSEATAQAIVALTAMGIDPAGEPFTKSQNLVEHLLSFQNEDGGFRHTYDYPASNGMATEQALLALVAYKLFLENKGSLYEFDIALSDDESTDDENETNEPETPNTDENDYESESSKEVKIVNIEHLTTNKDVIIEVNPGETVVFTKNNSSSDAKLVLPENLPAGTKVKVSKPDSAILANIQNLSLAGDVFDITLEFPSDKTFENGEFILTLTVDENIPFKRANIYHYNEQTGEWELVVPIIERDEKNNSITVKVSHFSVYAVLAAAENLTEDTSREDTVEHDDGRQSTTNNIDNNEVKNSKVNIESNNENKTKVTNENAENKLPATATNSYNVLLFAIMLLMIGAIFHMFQRKKLNE